MEARYSPPFGENVSIAHYFY